VRGGSPSEQFGPYLVYEQLGVGGMASVHRAEVKGIEDFRRPVALKRMLPHVAGNEDLVKSFVREARLAAHLRHENVAQTYDLGRVGETYFIAMELVVGRDLRQILRRSAHVGPIPVPVILNILAQVCDALDYAHNLCDETGQRLGIVHRDVSPSNILLADSGVVKLIDFGIAKASAAGMQTMSGVLKGKFGYMAPEYIKGSIDARADLFAIGVVAYELLTSRPLFSGRDDLDTLNRVQDMPIDPPSTKNPAVPHEIDEIIMTALARDPDRRWQQASAMRNAMTTLSSRLGLQITNGQVVEWVNWLFGQNIDDDDDEPSISISTAVDPQTKELRSPSTVKLVTQPQAVEQLRTPQSLPLGTPPRMTAQRSAAPVDDALPTLIRGLGNGPPTVRVSGLRSADDVQTLPAEPALRPSGPRPVQRMSGQGASELADDATTGLRHIAVAPPAAVTPLAPAPVLPANALSSSPPRANALSSSPPQPSPFVSRPPSDRQLSTHAATLPSTPLSRLRPNRPPSYEPARVPAASMPPQNRAPEHALTPPRDAEPMTRPRKSRFPWIAILVLLAAAAAAAVVYFVLPLVA
jgi:serine/threonine protein kinase